MPDTPKYHKFHTLLKLMMSIPFIGLFIKIFYKRRYPSLEREVCGIKFPNPLGLGGGVDFDAEYYNTLSDAGFGFVEVGSLTPQPQGGQMPNKGLKSAVSRLSKKRPKAITGANISKNLTTSNELAPKDYEKCLALLYDFVDFFVVNVSSPSDSSMQELQDVDQLTEIMDRLIDMRMYFDLYRPIFIKISPDLPFSEIDDIVEYCLRSGIDGIVACNLSTNPRIDLYSRSLEIVKHIHEKSHGLLAIIASGGIKTPEQAKEMLDAGASLVEFCTAFVTNGPSLVKKTLKYLVKHSK